MGAKHVHVNGDSDAPIPIGRRGRVAVPDVPIPATPLIGREDAIRHAIAHIRDPEVRLVTLTGPGGIGKTRLAIAVAHEVGGDICFVPLAAVDHLDRIAPAILRALEVEHAGALPAAALLRDVLRDRSLLLVLDSVEHLLDGTSLVSDLLQVCPHLTVLATSRTRLGLSGEHMLPVEPLTAPDPSHLPPLDEVAAASGIRLYVDRARAVHPTFALTEANAAAIATICERLDGLPLAIELAAARSNVLSPQALAARLEHRLELLTGGPRDAPERHQTMRAAIAWSADLLHDADRTFWQRLGVFVGGFTAEAAEAVGNRKDTVDALGSLVDQGLLRPAANAAGEPRFVILETARDYAREQLEAQEEDTATRDAHADWFGTFAREAEPGLMGRQPELWFHRVEADIANIRAALAWLIDREAIRPALELAGALAWFWTAPNYITEGRAWYNALLGSATHGIEPAVLAKAMMAAGDLADWQTDTERAEALNRQALARWREAGDQRGTAAALRSLGSAAIDRFAFDEAVELLSESHQLATTSGDAWNVAAAANLLGVASKEQGRTEDAIRWHETALRTWQQLGDRSHFPVALNGLGWGHLALGHDQLAWESFEAAISIPGNAELDWDVAWSIVGFAAIASRHREFTEAATLLAAAAHQRQELGLPLRPPMQRTVDEQTRAAENALGSAAFARAWADGQALRAEVAVQRARDVAVATPPADDGLSPREREVLALLVEGASDNEIADALFITRRTASKHVAAILDKLGASNRTAAATIAHRRGLV